MTFGQATIYGLVQGITEFLPISSSAHLALLPWIFGWKDPGQTFDVALHLGTLVAVAGYFFRDWREVLLGAWENPRGPMGRRLLLLTLATLPACLAGLLLEKQAESLFRNPARIAAALAFFGLLLGAADRWSRRWRGLEEMGLQQGLWVGAAQALAIIPGVSRSGVTMTAGLALGFSRDAAARFSFLLALPITAGAALFKLRHLEAVALTPAFFWAIFVSGISGAAVVHVFLKQVRRASLLPYAAYRLLIAALIALAL